ncbi:hypothetical protein A2Y83_03010 [Candidatus Falkowbacteria bacterium RBG_13_39_14]|uniref:Uncharacterized protein n=1 Tax=Candidatus Falkowbacteria bacterium RBG_13_39_14 TaxID=1797985 RepID=A0A1F5S0U0_9BACT|nr:MAG: hypothetical protein A2Y83_03010 [Candidatus Falkowbacteria bacterium RBG_13_39_14]
MGCAREKKGFYECSFLKFFLSDIIVSVYNMVVIWPLLIFSAASFINALYDKRCNNKTTK